MSYKLYLWGSLSALEWSQAVWKVSGGAVDLDLCEQELIREVFLRHLPRDGLILDAGCGTGRWPIYLRRRGYPMLGVDISHEAAVIAKSDEPELGITQADVWQLPFKSQSLDAVLSLGVVEHNEAGPLDALRESHRVLKPNGLLVLAVPYNNLFRRLIANQLQAYVTWKRMRINPQFQFGEYRFSRRELGRFLDQTGFETVAVYPNDTLPPCTVGLWVDYNNLTYSPLAPRTLEPFVLPGRKGAVAQCVLRWFPWLVCGEIVVVARARRRQP